MSRTLIAAGRRTLAVYLSLAIVAGTVVSPSTADAPPSGGRVRGWTSTIMPDGRTLVVGGETSRGVTAQVSIVDGGTETPLSRGLVHARAWHSATMLADGRVLVHGGIGTNGRVVLESEIFDPATQTFRTVITGLSPRAHHTATLLTGNQVVVVGGISAQGDVLPTAELWNPATNTITIVEDRLRTGRSRHSATLLADGRALITAGANAQGTAVTDSEAFDPILHRFGPASASLGEQTTLPAELEAAIPEHGTAGVPTDVLIALRFSRPLRAETLTNQSITLWGPSGSHRVGIVPAEGGRLVFVTPQGALVSGSRYAITVHDATDDAGYRLSPFTIEFTTVASASHSDAGQVQPAPATEASADDEAWAPPTQLTRPHWRTNRPSGISAAQAIAALQAPPGVTALAGQVLRLNAEPLANVTLRIGPTAVRTDDTGRFLLTGVDAGVYELVIDGQTASGPGRTYGRFAVNVELKHGRTEVLPYTIWLPKLDTAHAVTIPSHTGTEVVVTTPRIPGLELRIPPDAWIRDEAGRPVTEITITPIPLDRPPFPLPEGVPVPVYFTIQPGGARIYTRDGSGARVIFPNSLGKAPGEKLPFWDYDAHRKGWYVLGHGTVTADGRQITPDPGVVIHEFRAVVDPEEDAPAVGPPAGTTGRGSTQVDLATGLFVLQRSDIHVRDIIPINLTRTYRPGDSQSRAFGLGATHPYEMFLRQNANPYTWMDLVLPDGGLVHFDRISTGTGYADAVYEHTTSPSAFYKARISWNGSGWDVRLKNGTIYVFPNGNGAPLNSIRDRNGNTLAFTRSAGAWGRITRLTTPNGRWLDFTSDAAARITQIKDNISRTVSYGYDTSGRLTSVTDPAGGVTQYTYDSSHRMLTLRDPRGIVFLTNEFDSNGRTIRQTRADASTYQFAYTVDGTGKITQVDVTDPRTYVRRVAFNGSGYVSTNIRALGTAVQQTTTSERQATTNLLMATIDPLGRRTEQTYDAMGNVLTTTRLAGTPGAVTTAYTYEPTFNHVLTVTNPLGHTMTFSYDAQGNLLITQDPLGHLTAFTYNSTGQPLTKHLPGDAAATTYSYEFGDLVVSADPLGNQTQRFLDAAGRTVTIKDALKRSRRYEWDALDRLLRFVDPLANAAVMTYDGNGNALSVTDPAREIAGITTSGVTSWTPDTMNRLDTRIDALGRLDRSTYDAVGNLTSFTDRKGQVTALTYDPLHRPTQALLPDASTTAYTWDAADRLVQIVDTISGTLTRSYDALDRLLQETTPQGIVSYTYDAAGRRTSMIVAGQSTVTYTYDAANRLTQIAQAGAITTYEYDAAGRRTRLTLPNGVSTGYSYDAASRLTALTYTRQGTVIGAVAYAYDAAGKRTRASGTWARTTLPAAMATATYNAANHQLTFAGQGLSYDQNGSLIGDGEKTYSWDARGRLSAISGTGLSAVFQYDPFGRRTAKTVNGATTTYLYDGANIVQENTGIGTVSVLTGLAVDEYLTRSDIDGRRSFLADAVGSTVALTDDTGAVTTEYTYGPFGVTTVAGASSTNPFQFTGRENDAATGLYYYRTRYYSPIKARFISEDALEVDPADINLYVYVGNDPINFVDPYGESAEAALLRVNALARWGLAAMRAAAAEGGFVVLGVAIVVLAILLNALREMLAEVLADRAMASGGSPNPGPPPGAAAKAGGAGDAASKRAWPKAGHGDQLPQGGDVPYVPPKGSHGTPKRLKGKQGFEDAAGNRWQWARDQHGGEHWDVQLKDGGYINVTPQGKVRK